MLIIYANFFLFTMKFAHLADCHLGGWRQPELQELNMQSFKKAIEICIEEQVEFILFTGDLFDSAFPPIEILKETFSEFRKLKEAKILIDASQKERNRQLLQNHQGNVNFNVNL